MLKMFGKSSSTPYAPKYRTSEMKSLDKKVPKLDKQYSSARPKTPTGNHEVTPLAKTYIDLRDTTPNELAYTRAQVDLLATLPSAAHYNAAMRQENNERRVDIRPQPGRVSSQAAGVPDPSARDNGITMTSRDKAVIKHAMYMGVNEAGHVVRGEGTSAIIHHNPFLYTEHNYQAQTLDVFHSGVSKQARIAEGAAMLGHELQHSLHYANGVRHPDEVQEEEGTTANKNDPGFVEDQVRSELGLPERYTYYYAKGTNQTTLKNIKWRNDENMEYY